MGTTKTLAAFVAASAQAGGPPSISEVAIELNVSKSTARDRMNELVDAGLLDRQDGRQRGYTLSDIGKAVCV